MIEEVAEEVIEFELPNEESDLNVPVSLENVKTEVKEKKLVDFTRAYAKADQEIK